MTQTIIAFTGISGVGKTTFLQRLRGYIAFQHLTGGSLISEARQETDETRDRLRLADLDENQRLLIRGFALARDPEAGLIIVDGHVVIDHSNGIQDVPATVFERLGTTLMVHLEADPNLILRNRTGDIARDRPVYSVEVISSHQELSRMRALDISRILNIEYIMVKHDDVLALATLLQQKLIL